MLCEACGQQTLENSNFCIHCGSRLPVFAPLPEAKAEQPTKPVRSGKWMNIVSLCLGVVSVVYFGIEGRLLGVGAIVFGVMGLKKSGKPMGVSGIVLGGVGLLLAMIGLLISYVFGNIAAWLSSVLADAFVDVIQEFFSNGFAQGFEPNMGEALEQMASGLKIGF